MTIKVGDIIAGAPEGDTLAALSVLDPEFDVHADRYRKARTEFDVHADRYRKARTEIVALPTVMPPPDPPIPPRKFHPPGMPAYTITVQNDLAGPVPPRCLVEFRVPYGAPEGTPVRLHAFAFLKERMWLHMLPWRRAVAMELNYGPGPATFLPGRSPRSCSTR